MRILMIWYDTDVAGMRTSDDRLNMLLIIIEKKRIQMALSLAGLLRQPD